MSWQDIVLGVGSVGFVIALLPAMKNRQKPPVSTCSINTVILISIICVYISFQLWLTVFIQIIITFQWIYIGWKRYQSDKGK